MLFFKLGAHLQRVSRTWFIVIAEIMPNPFDTLKNLEMIEKQTVSLDRQIAH